MKTDTDTPESGSVWPEILRLREIIKSLEMQLAASQQEVERLRELLNRAIKIAKITTEYIEDPDRRKHYRSEIQRLAPAPEEPVIQDSRITETDPVPTQLPTQNEWRELEEELEGYKRSFDILMAHFLKESK